MSRSPGVGPCDHAHGTPSTPSRIRRYRANPASRLPSPATGRPSPSRRRARRDVPVPCSKATGSAFHQPRPHRIPFHVPCRCQQVRLVHHQGSKPPLPQIAAPLLSKLNPPPVASMAFADRRRNAYSLAGTASQCPWFGTRQSPQISTPSSPHHSAISSRYAAYSPSWKNVCRRRFPRWVTWRGIPGMTTRASLPRHRVSPKLSQNVNN